MPMLIRATRTKDRFTIEPSVHAVAAQASALALPPTALTGARVEALTSAATAAAGIPAVFDGTSGAVFGGNFGGNF